MQQGFLQNGYGGGDDNIKQANSDEERSTTPLEWLAIAGCMCLVYMVIVFMWIVCMAGIRNNFEATVICFMVIFFCMYIPGIAFFWYKGLQERDELIKRFIEEKLREQQQDLGS